MTRASAWRTRSNGWRAVKLVLAAALAWPMGAASVMASAQDQALRAEARAQNPITRRDIEHDPDWQTPSAAEASGERGPDAQVMLTNAAPMVLSTADEMARDIGLKEGVDSWPGDDDAAQMLPIHAGLTRAALFDAILASEQGLTRDALAQQFGLPISKPPVKTDVPGLSDLLRLGLVEETSPTAGSSVYRVAETARLAASKIRPTLEEIDQPKPAGRLTRRDLTGARARIQQAMGDASDQTQQAAALSQFKISLTVPRYPSARHIEDVTKLAGRVDEVVQLDPDRDAPVVGGQPLIFARIGRGQTQANLDRALTAPPGDYYVIGTHRGPVLVAKLLDGQGFDRVKVAYLPLVNPEATNEALDILRQRFGADQVTVSMLEPIVPVEVGVHPVSSLEGRFEVSLQLRPTAAEIRQALGASLPPSLTTRQERFQFVLDALQRIDTPEATKLVRRLTSLQQLLPVTEPLPIWDAILAEDLDGDEAEVLSLALLPTVLPSFSPAAREAFRAITVRIVSEHWTPKDAPRIAAAINDAPGLSAKERTQLAAALLPPVLGASGADEGLKPETATTPDSREGEIAGDRPTHGALDMAAAPAPIVGSSPITWEELEAIFRAHPDVQLERDPEITSHLVRISTMHEVVRIQVSPRALPEDLVRALYKPRWVFHKARQDYESIRNAVLDLARERAPQWLGIEPLTDSTHASSLTWSDLDERAKQSPGVEILRNRSKKTPATFHVFSDDKGVKRLQVVVSVQATPADVVHAVLNRVPLEGESAFKGMQEQLREIVQQKAPELLQKKAPELLQTAVVEVEDAATKRPRPSSLTRQELEDVLKPFSQVRLLWGGVKASIRIGSGGKYQGRLGEILIRTAPETTPDEVAQAILRRQTLSFERERWLPIREAVEALVDRRAPELKLNDAERELAWRRAGEPLSAGRAQSPVEDAVSPSSLAEESPVDSGKTFIARTGQATVSAAKRQEMDAKVRGVIGAAFGAGKALEIGPGTKPLTQQTGDKELIARANDALEWLDRAAHEVGPSLLEQIKARRIVLLAQDENPALLSDGDFHLIGSSGHFKWRDDATGSHYFKLALIEAAPRALGERGGLEFLRALIRHEDGVLLHGRYVEPVDADVLHRGFAAISEYLRGQALAREEAALTRPFQTDAEAHLNAHSDVLRPILRAVQDAGGRLRVRTITFGRGQKVDAVAISRSALASSLRGYLGATPALAGLETFAADLQNPWIDFSITTLRTSDGRGLNADAVRKALAADPQAILIETPAEVDNKGKKGKPGQIDSRAFAERMSELLIEALSARGIDSNLPASPAASLPTMVQVTNSSVPGELKLTTFIPTPTSNVGRLMQLALQGGIDLKELIEEAMPAPRSAEPGPLLGERVSQPAPIPARAEETPRASPLAGLTLAGIGLDWRLQTIFLDDPAQTLEPGAINELEEIVARVRESRQLVRLVVPSASAMANAIETTLQAVAPPDEGHRDLTISTHRIRHRGQDYTAIIIQPKIRVVFVGYGNENIKLAPAFETAGFGKPAVTINSLARVERVLHAFQMGYDIYVTDRDPEALAQFERELRAKLVEAYIARNRNLLLERIPESERASSSEVVLAQAQQLGRDEAERVFQAQYKGLFSTALMAGAFDLVMDGSTEKVGAQNKAQLYTPAASKYPHMRFIYQGGEGKDVGDISFSAITADFGGVSQENVQHARHVSCNTTALTTFLSTLMRALGVPLVADNLAIRRVVDPGDLKGSITSVQYVSGYHHGPDALTALDETDRSMLWGLNTDAAQSGSSTRFHIHALSIRRPDGQPLDKRSVQQVLAMQSRVALVDFPGGVFDPTRLNELSHNLLPQWLAWTPDGANHPLVPMVTVWETDDPSELMLVYAVPQESIVAPGNVNLAHALFGLASRDASLAIVNDAMAVPALVSAIESRLPVDGLLQESPDAPSQEDTDHPERGIYAIFRDDGQADMPTSVAQIAGYLASIARPEGAGRLRLLEDVTDVEVQQELGRLKTLAAQMPDGDLRAAVEWVASLTVQGPKQLVASSPLPTALAQRLAARQFVLPFAVEGVSPDGRSAPPRRALETAAWTALSRDEAQRLAEAEAAFALRRPEGVERSFPQAITSAIAVEVLPYRGAAHAAADQKAALKSAADDWATKVSNLMTYHQDYRAITIAAEGVQDQKQGDLDETAVAKQAGQVINPRGKGPLVFTAEDDVENTESFALDNEGRHGEALTPSDGATTFYATGEAIRRTGFVPEMYADMLIAHVPADLPPDRRAAIQATLDPLVQEVDAEGHPIERARDEQGHPIHAQGDFAARVLRLDELIPNRAPYLTKKHLDLGKLPPEVLNSLLDRTPQPMVDRMRQTLEELADANGLTINDVEVVVMLRDRELPRRLALRKLQRQAAADGKALRITEITDGTNTPGKLAALGGRSPHGKLLVVWTVGKSTETLSNLADVKAVSGSGSVGAVRLYSGEVAATSDLTARHDFTEEEQRDLRIARSVPDQREQELVPEEHIYRPNDDAEIIAGRKVFRPTDLADAKGRASLDSAMTFLTDSYWFGLPGPQQVGEGTYRIVTVRIDDAEGLGNGSAWIDVKDHDARQVHRDVTAAQLKKAVADSNDDTVTLTWAPTAVVQPEAAHPTAPVAVRFAEPTDEWPHGRMEILADETRPPEEVLAALATMRMPANAPEPWIALRHRLYELARTKGLIDGGTQHESDIRIAQTEQTPADEARQRLVREFPALKALSATDEATVRAVNARLDAMLAAEPRQIVLMPSAFAAAPDTALWIEQVLRRLAERLAARGTPATMADAAQHLQFVLWFPGEQDAEAAFAHLAEQIAQASAVDGHPVARLARDWFAEVRTSRPLGSQPSDSAQASQSGRTGQVLDLMTIAGISPDVLRDAEARKMAINHYNAQAAGARALLENGGHAATTKDVERITPATPDQKIDALQTVAKGQRVSIVFAADRATRMKMPYAFDRLGIAGLTPRILNALPQDENAPEEAFAQAAALVDRAAGGIVEDLNDLSLIQRQLLQLRWQLEQDVMAYPEAGVSLEQVLANAAFVVIVNESNREAVGRQLAGIRFVGLRPERIFLLEQREVGGELIREDGTTEWYDQERWPEGHGEPFVAMARRTEGSYRLDAAGRSMPLAKPLAAVLGEEGIQRAIFGQVNDLHLLRDMTMVARWAVAERLMQTRQAKMVLETVDNPAMPNATKHQKGGALFVNPAGFQVLRDTVGLQDPSDRELEEHYAFSEVISRMLYVLDISALGELGEKSLPAYLNERNAKSGPVLTREFYSGDATSALPSLAMQQQDLSLDTFKMRPRIPFALRVVDQQNAQPGFGELVESLRRLVAQSTSRSRAAVAIGSADDVQAWRAGGGEAARVARVEVPQPTAESPSATVSAPAVSAVLDRALDNIAASAPGQAEAAAATDRALPPESAPPSTSGFDALDALDVPIVTVSDPATAQRVRDYQRSMRESMSAD